MSFDLTEREEPFVNELVDNGQYIRIAGRTRAENEVILTALREVVSLCLAV